MSDFLIILSCILYFWSFYSYIPYNVLILIIFFRKLNAEIEYGRKFDMMVKKVYQEKT